MTTEQTEDRTGSAGKQPRGGRGGDCPRIQGFLSTGLFSHVCGLNDFGICLEINPR